MKRFWIWFLVIIALEVLSRLVIFDSTMNSVVTVGVGLLVLLLTLKRPTIALAALSIEFLIGSQGALLKIDGDLNNNGGVSLRIVLFTAFLFGWLLMSFPRRSWSNVKVLLKERRMYFVLAFVLVYAFVLGWVRGNRQFLFVDANAWGLWLLLLPVLDICSRLKLEVKRDVVPACLAALIWLPVKTITVFYLFSHEFSSVGAPLYLWIRRTGVGEITHLLLNAHRIFFQSQVYGVLAILVLFAILIYRVKWSKPMMILLVLSMMEIVISLSRSFWIGLGVGLCVIFFVNWFRTKKFPVRALGIFGAAGIASLLLVQLVLAFPLPRVQSTSLIDLFRARVDVSENAALSRWQMLPVLWSKIKEHPIFGSGFGAAVTYQSADPRLVQASAGRDTTYAFEWGWLDHWIKFGIIGIPLIAFLLLDLGRRTWQSSFPEWLRLSAIASLAALAAIHIFTPYLNHPLGFFVLLFMEGMLVTSTGYAEGNSPARSNV